MIEILTRQWNADLATLPWVGKYGGIVRPLTMVFEGPEESTVEKTFPVSADFHDPDNCAQDFYMDLVPDSDKGAVLYWESAGDLTRQEFAEKGKRRYVIFQGNVRLVGWINLLKLGLQDEFGAVEVLTAPIIKMIDSTVKPTQFQYKGLYFHRVKWTFQGWEEKTPGIFDQYSYEDNSLLVYPYDYFAMNWTVSFMISLDCLADYYTNFVEGCWDPVYVGTELAELADLDEAGLTDLDGTKLIDFSNS